MSEKDLEKQELITSRETEIVADADLREKFVQQYASKMGWNVTSLTDEQMNEIKSQKGYQCPGMICG